MLSKNIFCALVILLLLQSSKAQRKIINGHKVESDKAYAVYLTKASKSPKAYDYWLCGGALVTTWFIITSAACVEDVEFMYAIAGYKKYVPYDEIDNDECTKNTKKKVIFTCVPKKYEFDYEKIEKWSYIDIAVVKVESEYNFNDDKYTKLCSYRPRTIQVNYDAKYQEPNTDAIVLGWGHEEKWRKPEDNKNYNQQYLQYASTLILEKKECKGYFANFTGLDNIIDKYMICTLEKGNINENGEAINKPKLLADGCTPIVQLLVEGEIACEEDETILTDETRRTNKNMIARILNRQQQTRREGICQNDHGGPLVTWMGGHELLIGVASVFRVTEDSRCSGPFLFTSTQCNGMFLDCVINSDHSTKDEKQSLKHESHLKDKEPAPLDNIAPKKRNRTCHKRPANGKKLERSPDDDHCDIDSDGDILKLLLNENEKEPERSPEVDMGDIDFDGELSRLLQFRRKNRQALCDSPPSEKGYDTSSRHISWMNHPDGPAENEMMFRPQIPIQNY